MTPGDRLEAHLVRAIAELKGSPPMSREFQRPVELAALKGRLERAKRVEARIADTGERYDRVLDAIEEKEAQAAAHAGHLEKYDAELGDMIEKMIGGSNNPPTSAAGANGAAGHAKTGDEVKQP